MDYIGVCLRVEPTVAIGYNFWFQATKFDQERSEIQYTKKDSMTLSINGQYTKNDFSGKTTDQMSKNIASSHLYDSIYQ
jgi:hypothetical protein